MIINNKINTRYLFIKISLNILLSLFLYHFLLTYFLVINLLGLPQNKHVGEVIKIKLLKNKINKLLLILKNQIVKKHCENKFDFIN